MEKKPVCVNLSLDTIERLKLYAYQQHKSVSQVITDFIWKQKIDSNTIRGQYSIK